MKPQLPKTDSIRELAEFWDTHDLADFEDQLEEIGDRVFGRRRTSSVAVPLSGDERQAVRQMAAARGLDEAALIREWVQEKLHQG